MIIRDQVPLLSFSWMATGVVTTERLLMKELMAIAGTAAAMTARKAHHPASPRVTASSTMYRAYDHAAAELSHRRFASTILRGSNTLWKSTCSRPPMSKMSGDFGVEG